MRLQILGLDILGGADTVPAAVSYTDHDTVLAVQTALKAKGFNPGKLDGVFGPNTSRAIKAMQTAIGVPTTGVVDYAVLSALKVPAPAYSPTVTTAGRSASAAAKDADEVASHAQTPADVQNAATQVAAANAVAIPPPSPETQEKVAKAQIAAKAATTPAQVEAAKQQVQEAAKAVAAETGGFWSKPLWNGAPINRWQSAATGAGLALVVTGFVMAVRK